MRGLFAIGMALGLTIALLRVPTPTEPVALAPDEQTQADAGAEPGADGGVDDTEDTQPDEPEGEAAGTEGQPPAQPAQPIDPATAPALGDDSADQADQADQAEQAEGETQATTGAPEPEQTTVQVLDGVGDRVRMRAAAEVLREMGYQIVATNPAAIEYDTTTILYSDGHRAAAEALRARDARFRAIRPNKNLSTQVDIHVVVGTDWQR